MTTYFAIVTRGLEEIAREDLQRSVPGVQVEPPAYRRLRFAYGGPPARLLGLRGVDDVFVSVGEFGGMRPQRAALEGLRAWLAQADWRAAQAVVAAARRMADPPQFAVSASFVGRRNYASADIKHIVTAALAARYGWQPAEDDVADLSARIFVDGDLALVGLRLGTRPLHRRSYKQDSRPASLKASVAWNMLRMLEVAPGQIVLDPLCGAGTLAIEAALAGAQVVGGDVAPDALVAARANARRAGAAVTWAAWDAGRVALPDGAVDRVACNLPFGRQIAAGPEGAAGPALRALYARALAEIARVLRPGGRAALLTTQRDDLHAALAAQPQLSALRAVEISLFGQTPEIVIVGKRLDRAP